ncbi:MAG: class I tRNA ligase family protein, partial [Pseudomonadota bacterium]
ARMIMMTLKFTGEVPFRTVYVHGLVRDADGNKMSKTKGNGLDPIDFMDGISADALVAKRTTNLTQPKMAARIEKATRKEFPEGIAAYGTDSLRFTFAALASPGRDVRFDSQRVAGYRNFCNKLWNASRFVLTNTEDLDLTGPQTRTLADRWILAELRELLERTERAVATYRFDLYAAAVYDFAWHEYCDWYLELTKPLLWDEDAAPEVQRGTRATLLQALEMLLRIAHPIIPYITESLWQNVAPRLGNAAPTIMEQPFPTLADCLEDAEATAAIRWLKAVVDGVRNIRGEAGIKPAQSISLLLQGGGASERSHCAATAEILKRLAKVETIEWLADDAEPPPNALALVDALKVMVPLKGLIDVDAEKARLSKEIERQRGELKRVEGKLANERFVAKAPAAVVEKEQGKATELRTSLATLDEQLAGLDQLR